MAQTTVQFTYPEAAQTAAAGECRPALRNPRRPVSSPQDEVRMEQVRMDCSVMVAPSKAAARRRQDESRAFFMAHFDGECMGPCEDPGCHVCAEQEDED